MPSSTAGLTLAEMGSELSVPISKLDSLSEISECTSMSLSECTSLTGLDGENLYEERFRVDRTKLESMILDARDGDCDKATKFFQKIMEDTGCKILWPTKLKANARNKKDPHIRVIGDPEYAQKARDRILALLNGRGNRVTVKMDISYTDHSHIIGKEGRTIQQVMSCTQCHIHFPDSNRLSTTDKSNQVSIAGDVENVENARAQVRNLMPLVFMFEVDPLFALPDNSQRVKELQASLNVQVFVRSHPVRPTTQVCVKGNYWELSQVKQATMLLVNFFTGRQPNTVPVQMTLEISVQHHRAVCGDNGVTVKLIEQRTATTIAYPDLTDPTVPPLRKSTFTISGGIDNVFLAREMLIGCLPLSLMFDILEDAELERNRVEDIMRRYQVIVRVKPKPRQPMKSVILLGVEKQATNIYEARRKLLGSEQPLVVANIPHTYWIPKAAPLCGIDVDVSECLQIPSPASPIPQKNNGSQWLMGGNYSSAAAYFPPMVSNHPNFWPTQNTYKSNNYSSNPLSQMTCQNQIDNGYNRCSYSDTFNTSRTSDGNSTSGPSSGTASPEFGDSDDDLKSILQCIPDRRAPGCEKAAIQDYQSQKLMAMRAMRTNPQPNVVRVPNSSWSGLGFSKTTPAAALSEKFNEMKSPWNTSNSAINEGAVGGIVNENTNNLSKSSYLDSSPAVCNTPKYKMDDLPALLSSLSLGKYTDLFMAQEIDLPTFLTLTEKDLHDVGVSTFGARRKLLMAIQSCLNKNNPFRTGEMNNETSW